MNHLSPSDPRIVAFCNGMLWIDEHGFCRTRHIGPCGQHMGPQEIEEMGRITHEICEGKKLKHIVDIRGVNYTLMPGGRESICNNEKLNACRTAVAAIVDSAAVRIVVEMLINLNKPTYPYRIFSNEEDAVMWLKEI